MADSSVLTNQPVVIDNGSGIIKAGFAGDSHPKVLFSNYVGSPKHVKVMAGAVEGDHFTGSKAEELRGLLKLRYPMEHGIVTDWNGMERVWKSCYSEMRIQTEDHPVLLTEAPLNPRENRERAAQIFFETFNAPALFISIQAVLSLYASGRTTGVVLDIGDGVTHAVPVYEGFALPHAIQRANLAGRDVTEYMQRLLMRCGKGYDFHTSAEKEVVRQMKEKVCYVAEDVRKEEESLEATATKNKLVEYKLPDGQVVQIGAECFRAPELLFQPHLMGHEYPGCHETLTNSIMRTDLDLRRNLYSNIVLAGGSTLFPGFGERLLKETLKLAPVDTKIKISAPPERRFSTWVGGSILASLATFRQMWISAEEYEERGANVLHRKCF